MHYFLLIYFSNKPLHVSSRLAAYYQEEQLCVDSNWYSQHNAVYTELTLLMMNSKPARNMKRFIIEIN
jgi:hypothetical protein